MSGVSADGWIRPDARASSGSEASTGSHAVPRSPARLMISPFQRLTRVHAVATGTDAVIAVALAGSIFFSISPDAARQRVALYLALTMAPFAVVAPLIGPVIDQMPGGSRLMVFFTTSGRCVVAFLMIGHIDTLWLFPEAFALLVLQKSYAVAKSAVLPNYVSTESNLVQANGRLALVSAVMSLVGAGLGGLLVWLGGPSWAAAAAMIGYGVAAAAAIRLPLISASSVVAAVGKSSGQAYALLPAATSMAVLRASVGFVTFLLAFELRGGTEGLDVSKLGAAAGAAVATARNIDLGDYLDVIVGDPGAPPWHFGVVAAAAGLSAFTGVRLAPLLRRWVVEETILRGALAVGSAAALVAALSGGLIGLALLAGGVAVSSAAGKLAFDSLVQRDAPDANHGRSFAKFETRFQIAWVAGALVPVVVPVLLPVPARLGELAVAAALGFVLVTGLLGRHAEG